MAQVVARVFPVRLIGLSRRGPVVECETNSLSPVNGRGHISIKRPLHATFDRNILKNGENRWTEPERGRTAVRYHRVSHPNATGMLASKFSKSAVVPLVIASPQPCRPEAVDRVPGGRVGAPAALLREEAGVPSSEP